MFNLTTGRIGSGLVDFGALEGERIRDSYVAGNVGEDNGILRRDGIELLAIGEPLLRPERVVPAAAGDPLAFFVLRYGRGYALLHFLDGRYARQRDGKFIGSGAAKMHVRIVEAGHYKLAVEMDRLRAFLASSAIEQDVGHSADASNLSLADSHGLGPRLRGIVRVNAPMRVEDPARSFLCR